MRFLAALLLALAVCAAHAQPPPTQRTAAMNRELFQAASQSLAAFQNVVTAQNFRQMGFETPGEVRSATLGQPVPVFMVRLDELRAYRAGNDPNALLKDLHQVIFPVLVSDRVRSSLTLEERNGRWQGTGFGGPRLAQSMERARRDSASASGTPPQAYFLVHVAALNSHYLAHRAGTRLMLTTLVDDPALKVPAGRTVAAEEVFAALAPVAQRHNGLPS